MTGRISIMLATNNAFRRCSKEMRGFSKSLMFSSWLMILRSCLSLAFSRLDSFLYFDFLIRGSLLGVASFLIRVLFSWETAFFWGTVFFWGGSVCFGWRRNWVPQPLQANFLPRNFWETLYFFLQPGQLTLITLIWLSRGLIFEVLQLVAGSKSLSWIFDQFHSGMMTGPAESCFSLMIWITCYLYCIEDRITRNKAKYEA